MEIAERRHMTRGRLEGWMAELERSGAEGVALYIRSGQLSRYLPSLGSEYGRWLAEIEAVPATLAQSETGLVLFWSDERKHVLLPPFPVEANQCFPAWDTSSLRTLLAKKYLLGVVLLRLGGYSVGVFEGDRLLTSKTGTRYVKGRHRAGGRSQRRFERIREKQIQELFDKACWAVRTKFAAYDKRLDYVFLGGDRITLRSFLKRCDYLQALADKTLSRVLPVAKPRYEALRNIPSQIWKTAVFTLREGTE